MRMSSTPMTPIECTMMAQVMIAMVTRGVPPVEVLLEAVVAWPKEAEASWCVTIVAKLGIWLATVETPLRHVGITAQVLLLCQGQQYRTGPPWLVLGPSQDQVLGLSWRPYVRTPRQVALACFEYVS